MILADLWMGGLRMRKNPIAKIILGLLCPPTIASLEFKTREELELMPQTEEELHDAHNDSDTSRSSSSTSSRRSSIHGNDLDSLSSLELGGEAKSSRKFKSKSGFRTDTEVETETLPNKSYFTATVDNEDDFNGVHDFPNYRNGFLDFSVKKKTKPLKLKKKFYEFYAAPISKYICHSVSIF